MDIDPLRSRLLVRICHHRWSTVILIELLRREGCRFAELQHRTEASPVSLRAGLRALLDLGLVERNPGYGHPLRPEYILSEVGREVARICRDAIRSLGSFESASLTAMKWPLPVLDVIAAGLSRFSEIQGSLPGLTPRSLAQTLKALGAAGLITREVGNSYPPSVLYRVSRTGRTAGGRLRKLNRSASTLQQAGLLPEQ